VTNTTAAAASCTTCGQRIRKLNPHRMDRQKLRTLGDIAAFNAAGSEWVKTLEAPALQVGNEKRRSTYCGRNHAERLHWFGLLDYRGHRSGEFRVNAAGMAFLAGSGRVPAKIWCRGGVVKARSQSTVCVADIRGVILDRAYWDNYAAIQHHEPPEDDMPEPGPYGRGGGSGRTTLSRCSGSGNNSSASGDGARAPSPATSQGGHS